MEIYHKDLRSVTCLTATCVTADSGVASFIPAGSHTFMEIDHEISSTAMPPPLSADSRKVVGSYKRMYVHEVLVNCFIVKHVQEKKCG